MTDTGRSPGARRRERQPSSPRSHRVPLSFNVVEMDVLRAAAARESMAPASWAARAVMAVAQHVLVPVSAERADVLREFVRARAELRETAAVLDRLTARHASGPESARAVDGPAREGVHAVAENTVVEAVEDRVRDVLDDVRRAVARVDAATLQVMRERRERP
ncbi:hypothetical protein [Streptomyces sp. NPDC060184]|uniref:hypothetical protein n=1 Tax=Streptomyces sp. NPDC060184 TaxID=3347064 RepID=UPI0036696A25